MEYEVWAFLFLIAVMITNYLADKYVIKTKKIKRDVPSDLTPAEVSYLFHGVMEEDAIQATLLKLITEKKITYKKVEKDYHFTMMVPVETLTEEEQCIVNMIFEGFDTVTSKEFTEIDKDLYDGLAFKLDRKLVDKGFLHKHKFNVTGAISIIAFAISLITLYSFNTGFSVTSVSIFAISMLLIFILNVDKTIAIMLLVSYGFIHCNFNAAIVHGYSPIIIGAYILFALSSMPLFKHVIKVFNQKLTKQGKEKVDEILAFKKFVSISGLNDREVETIELWDKYLEYATAVGEGRAISSKLDLKFNTEYTSDDAFADMSVSLINAIPFVEIDSESLKKELRQERHDAKIKRLLVLNNGKRNMK